MRIAILADDFPPLSFGGAGISTFDLARGMKEAGQEVFVITTCRDVKDAGESIYEGLKVFRIQSSYKPRWRAYLSLYNPNVIKEVEKILHEIKPDVVHANNIHSHLSYCSLKLAKKYAKAVIITFRDVMSFHYTKLDTKRYLESLDAHTTWLDHLKEARKRWNPFRNLIIKYYLKYADKKFAVSFALKKALEQNGIKDVEVIRTGVKVSDWLSTEARQSDKKVVFFGGRLTTGAKGGRQVEEAFKIVREKYPEVELLKAGEEGWVSREEMKALYARSNLVLVPSVIFDSLPRIVLEAMAAGKPVIATHYGGAREAVEDGVTGYIVNPFDTKLLANKITDLLDHPDKAIEFGRKGRERIEKEFTLEQMVNKYLEAYRT